MDPRSEELDLLVQLIVVGATKCRVSSEGFSEAPDNTSRSSLVSYALAKVPDNHGSWLNTEQ